MGDMLYLSEADIAGLALPAGAIADALAEAFAARGRQMAQIPPKVILRQAEGADFYAMAGCVGGGISGVKWLGSAGAAGGPSFAGLLVLSDSRTGAPVAVLSASALTALRTAATTLLAARRLARPDAATLGLIGCGTQAAAHLRALAEEFPLREVLLCGRGPAGVGRLAGLARDLGLRAATAPVGALLAQSDIVVTSPPPAAMAAPFVDAALLRPGGFLSSVDHGTCLMPDSLPALDGLFTDDRPATAARALVDPHLAAMRFDGDLAAMPQGNGGRRLGFVFAGTALADLAAGQAAVAAARARRVGTLLPL